MGSFQLTGNREHKDKEEVVLMIPEFQEFSVVFLEFRWSYYEPGFSGLLTFLSPFLYICVHSKSKYISFTQPQINSPVNIFYPYNKYILINNTFYVINIKHWVNKYLF